MKVLSINFSHDASVSVILDGELVFYRMEERLVRKKHSSFPFYSLLEAKKNYDNFDLFVINGLHSGDNIFLHTNYWINFIKNLDCGATDDNVIVECQHHHLNHARTSFYNSGFEEALCIVLDGAGNIFENVFYDEVQCREMESIFYATKPNKFDLIYKRFFTGTGINNYKNCKGIWGQIKDCGDNLVNVEFSSNYSVGWKYEDCNRLIGFGDYDSGKSMGLSQCYGYESDIDNFWHEKAKICNNTQKNTFLQSLNLIETHLKLIKTKNLVISGGYGLNCVSNYEYLNQLDVNIFIDPLCDDSSISIGAGFFHYFETTKDFKNVKLKNVYLGYEEIEYDLSELNFEDCDDEKISDLLIDQKIIALFQGKSECGPRALGNRSILFDPRNPNGKDILNSVKKRESFRPFGATILEEHCQEWFDLRGMESSPFMLYAVKCKEHMRSKIPAVLHVDGTSRIQTINSIQNENFYNLINKFSQKTKIPMLLNTSFNIKGEPIVETFDDAINVFLNSKIDALYLPEISKIILK
jgi:carbamoyltransferase